MPGTDTSKAFSGCLQHKIQQFVVIFSIYPLTKVITYQFSHKARADCFAVVPAAYAAKALAYGRAPYTDI